MARLRGRHIIAPSLAACFTSIFQQAAREGGNRGGGKRKREEAAAFAKRVPLLKKNEDMAELVEGLRAHVDDHAAAQDHFLQSTRPLAALEAARQPIVAVVERGVAFTERAGS